MDSEALAAKKKKPYYSLIPPEALKRVAASFTLGAEKYGARDWEKGLPWGLYFSAAMRHLWAFWDGDESDEEGNDHLAAAVASIMILMKYSSEAKYELYDDRRV